MEHDVFISYSSKKKTAAQAVLHLLEQNGIRCWMAPRDIPPGAEYGDLIDDAIKHCKVMVVLFSEYAATSHWVKGEMNIAFEEQKIIIPVRLDKTPLRGQNRVILNQKHWIDAYPDYEIKFSELLTAVANSIGKAHDIEENEVNVKFSRKAIAKWLNVILLPILLTVIACVTYPLLRGVFHLYKYDREGLHICTRSLSSEQETAMTSILDNMVLVEGGSFMMGNNPMHSDYFTGQDSLSVNPHKVTLDNFYVCKYEVTQKEWKAFMDLDGRCIDDGENKAMDMLSWEDAVAFTEKLSELSGLDFALPSEAQWEYAAKGGQCSKGHVFSGHNYDATEVAWTSFDSLTSSHEVGGKRANELGLYDMTGNVSEWCKDYFAPYQVVELMNPEGPETGLNRVYRGGDFRMQNFFDMKTTTRYYDSPFVNRRGTGLRLVINIYEYEK
ncbi:MAG: SUMF1/EgtB/PvdO family nonheme iron enzyme [Bacteroidales bacterium]|nr:SUMF1/EgtB/PvdO family nonheme iron enzyme [Bacteroides sp.]MCM1198782.1 SUMF1/EgtB/PvdO family nonheme iron enzyme [Clostridium sp.]MCM1503089.1 SUMF1/EgtB/PvdO family nonheme iron enzyme [Bacteroidales bacterium]